MDSRERGRVLRGVAFITPNLLIFGGFTLIPVIATLVMSLFAWDPFTTPRFVGFANFNHALSDREFWYYLGNTLVFLLGLPITLFGSLLLATALHQKLRGRMAYRTLFYLPTITGGAALLLLWKTMFNKESGLINATILPLLQLVGVSGPDGQPLSMRDLPDWLLDTPTIFGVQIALAKPALIAMGVWGAIGGGSMLLYLAALSGISPEYYEAAEIDGASRWQRFWHITWPMVAPTTFFLLVTGVIGGLQGGVEMAILMTKGGGPDGATITIGYEIFRKAFLENQFGYAAALSVILFALIALVTAVNWRFGSRAGGW